MRVDGNREFIGATSPRPIPAAEPRGARRADARRNHASLLVVAREVFDELGADAPLDEAARRAGVATTLYRHFPDRRDLLVSVYDNELMALCAVGEAALESLSLGDALFAWLRALVATLATKPALAQGISGDTHDQPAGLFDCWHMALGATASELLAEAKCAGAVNADMVASDLLALTSGIALASTDTGQAERCVALLRGGMGEDPRATASGQRQAETSRALGADREPAPSQ